MPACLPCRAGEDLHKVLWLKSRNSEVWLERRTNYTRSTAVMSMVSGREAGGGLLGLEGRKMLGLTMRRMEMVYVCDLYQAAAMHHGLPA